MNHSISHFTDRGRLFLKLPILVKSLELPMREAIRAAHTAYGITPEEFVRGMLKMGGTGTPDLVMLRSGITLDASGDPYSQLDLQTSLKYLCCGGLRIVSDENGLREYATDQDAFFHFFGIDHCYEAVPQRPCGRMLKAGDFGRAMLRLHRILTEEDKESPFSLFSPKGLQRKVKVLLSLTQPLCDTPWEYQQQCEELMRQLVRAHFTAIDAEAEARCVKRKQDTESLFQQGCRLQHGDGVPRDPEAAVRYYQAAADQDHQAARLALGRCQQTGDGIQWNIPAAVAIYQELTAANYSPAMHALAECYLQGIGVEQSAEQAEYLYLRAADLGDTSAMNVLADGYQSGTRFARNLQKAFRLYARSADAGDPEGAFGIGECYRTGTGTDPDPVLAAHWFQQAADGGSALGMFALGSCYMDGAGLAEDACLAESWYRRAADAGMAMARAMADAATILLPDGNRACDTSLAASLSWLMALAHSGEASAAYLLARFYAEGICTEADSVLALSWYEAAAAAGSKPAARALAVCYLDGLGVDPDPVEALMVCCKAAGAGDQAAMHQLAGLLEQESVCRSFAHALRQLATKPKGASEDAV